MQYKIRMLISDGRLKAGETYWAEEFPSQRAWMFAGNLRIPKARVNEMFVYEGIDYMIPGLKKRIFLSETNKGYEVHIGGYKPFLLQNGTSKTIHFSKSNLYLTLRMNNNKVSHSLINGVTKEYA